MISKINFLVLFLSSVFVQLNAQAFLQIPIEGTQGNEWIIVNYVDWDTLGFLDHQCGTKSYDGHQGTDFVIQSFREMDDSVAVYAAADGMVIYTIDSLFDRESSGDIDKELGNTIALSHADNYYTYYGHLMKNSIQVVVGDSVKIGDIIAYVGSSGNSTDPHLHFELWYDSLYVIDPFAGYCGNPTPKFIDPPAYDTSLNVWESGLHLINDLNINHLRERIITLDRPYTIQPSSDSEINFWTHLYGLEKGKELSLKWYTPDDVEWFEYAFLLDKDYWYYYYWSFIDHQELSMGEWTVKLFYDGSEIVKESFKVQDPVTVKEINHNADCSGFENWSIERLLNTTTIEVLIVNMDGQNVTKVDRDLWASGIYFIYIHKDNMKCISKRWIGR